MGSEYIKVAEHIPAVKAMVPRILDEAVKSSSCHAICNDGTFDVDCDRPTTGLPQQSYAAVIDHSLLPKYAEHRAVMSALNEKVIKLAVDKRPNLLFNTHETTVLATKYAAYQISALHAVFNMNRDTNKDAVAAQVAVQNLLSQ